MNDVVKSPHFPQRAAKAAQTRRAVVAAAEQLFVDRGYGNTSIQEVAQLAGVSRATVYRVLAEHTDGSE